MNLDKQSANIISVILLAASAYITWKTLGVAGDSAYAGEQPVIWMSIAAFFVSISLVVLAIFIKAKYTN